MARHPFEFKGVDKPLMWHDLSIFTIERILFAVLIALDKSPDPAHPHLSLTEDQKVRAISL
jgi:hypothetical protein